MPELRFRNLDVTPDDPVDQWGFEGILAAIDRGSLRHWRRILDALEADPYGPVSRDLEQAIDAAEDVGVRERMRRALAAARIG
ncbi:hypothetical protein HH308_21140 [Gordonia sp. TBRC 11910]|uniref:Uncharacterized protein n=1 Tax=Gordonia asplenii TaxID=2725283 RepID=A0A848KYQ6_9ACTN|nr:hypothetical protein [Gordonia asplenii]NMO03726.1 hypothetical protein [Gordonia asplenii]